MQNNITIKLNLSPVQQCFLHSAIIQYKMCVQYEEELHELREVDEPYVRDAALLNALDILLMHIEHARSYMEDDLDWDSTKSYEFSVTQDERTQLIKFVAAERERYVQYNSTYLHTGYYDGYEYWKVWAYKIKQYDDILAQL